MNSPSPEPQVTLVNEQDEVIGQAGLIEAHEGNGLLHRATSVFLFRDSSGVIELLMQQRSAEKIVGAHEWANTVCGNVRPGETYEACALRRLQQELDIDFSETDLAPLMKFRYQVRCNERFSENELDMIFAGWYEGAVSPQPAEVAAVAWVPWKEILAAAQSSSFSVVASSVPAEFSWDNQSMKLAPWFIMMLKDPTVSRALTQFTETKS